MIILEVYFQEGKKVYHPRTATYCGNFGCNTVFCVTIHFMGFLSFWVTIMG